MRSPVKLLSTVAVTLILLGSAVSTPTTSASALRSPVEDTPQEDNEQGDERFLPAIYAGKVILHPYLDAFAPDRPHPPSPKLSQSRRRAQAKLLKLSGVHRQIPFELWLMHFAKGDEALQKPVFLRWFRRQLTPQSLARMLKEAGKSHEHHDGTNKVVVKYQEFYNDRKARGNRL